MKEIPPSFANATAIPSSETACITAETSGIFALILGSSPFLNLVIGVASDTFSGLASALEYPGTRRYSLNVLDGSVRTIAILHLSLSIYENQIVS